MHAGGGLRAVRVERACSVGVGGDPGFSQGVDALGQREVGVDAQACPSGVL